MFHTCATRFDGTKQGLNETHETKWHQNFHISEKNIVDNNIVVGLSLFCQVKNRELLERVSF